MTELEDGDDVFLRTDDKIYLQCTRTHENKQGTVPNIRKYPGLMKVGGPKPEKSIGNIL